jgi:hypothetical protein
MNEANNDEPALLPSPDLAALDRVLNMAPALAPREEFNRRVLAGFDALARRPRMLVAFAEAFGWRMLARPLAPVGIAAGVVAAGFTAGVVSTTAIAEADAYYYVSEAVLSTSELSGGIDP